MRETARLLWDARPVAYYAWSGVGQHTNATQTDRAISLLYALTGSHGRRGGNVQFAAVPANDVSGAEFPAPEAPTLGIDERPLGPPRSGWCTSRDFYRAVIEHEPYPIRGFVDFGVNLLISHAAAARGAEALRRLDFYVHADIHLNPTAEFADLVLPVNTAWEREALRVGFEITQEANALVQLRPPVVESRGESRSDGEIAFALAERLGLGKPVLGRRHGRRLPGVARPVRGLARDPPGPPRGGAVGRPRHPLRAAPGTGRVRHPVTSGRGLVRDVPTARTGSAPRVRPSGSECGPPAGPRGPLSAGADVRQASPLLPRSASEPAEAPPPPPRPARRGSTPDTARARGIEDGDWVGIRTPSGRVKARARLRDTLAPDVVAAQHGWWQHCEELGLPGFPAHGEGSANVNLVIDDAESDPISGSAPHRSYLCEIEPLPAP